MLGRDEDTNTALFFGYIGLLNLVALAPVVIVLSLTTAINFGTMSAGMFWLVVAKGGHFPELQFALQTYNSEVSVYH